MLTLEIEGVGEAVAAMDRMAEEIDGLYPLKMDEAFVAWQLQDMNRHYPSTVLDSPEIIYTMVYPRSRVVKRRSTAVNKPKKRTTGIVVPRHGVARPILRPELFEMLRVRMRGMLGAIKWR